MKKRRTEGHPILPIKLFDWFYENQGEDAAVEILDLVQEGKLKVENLEKAIKRSDMDSNDWQRFEEGWRPDNW